MLIPLTSQDLTPQVAQMTSGGTDCILADVTAAVKASKGGAVDNGPRFFRQPTCHHAPEVYGGLRESEAAAMLKAFFAARR